MSIGDTICVLRKEKGLTQSDLANLLNVSPKTISSWEKNRNLPSIDMLILLSNALDTNIDTIINLKNENKKEKSKIYEKKDFKNSIIKMLIIGIIFIIPILYFWYAGYITIAAYTAHIWIFEDVDLIETSQIMLNLFSHLVFEYFIYLILMLINYILYKKKLSSILLAINTFILTAIGFNRIDFVPIILLALIIIEIILGLLKSKKTLFYFNIIVASISFITYIILLISNSYVDLDYIIFIIACVIGICWAINSTTLKKLSII